MHIVSEVSGAVGGQDQFDQLSKTFPPARSPGPQIRAMEIIGAGEPGAGYGGTVGYFSLTGDMDTCITIRTMIVKGRPPSGGRASGRQRPAFEWTETCNKMGVLKRAVAMAEEGL